MTPRTTRLAAALACALVAAACKSGGSEPSTTELVTITAAQSSVFANGTNTVTLHVTTSGPGPINVSTSRGVFEDSLSTSTRVNGSAGDVVLRTCNAISDTVGCPGEARVTATRPGTSATATVVFGGLSLCASNCAADAACLHQACTSGATNGTCEGATAPLTCQPPQCPPNHPAQETTCYGGVDEDCNGQTDCADTACDGQPCDPANANFACQGGSCVDVTSGYSIALTSTATRLAANGSAQATLTATVRRNTVAVSGVTVDFSTTPGLGALSGPSAVTGADGRAIVTFTAGTAAGTSTVVAQLHLVSQVNASVAIAQPALQSLTPSAQQYQVMGVRYSGYRETNQITFQALDTGGLAYPPGLQVDFTHERLADSYLGVAPDCVAGPPALCSYSGVTDANGRVVVLLTSGRVAGVVSVNATATGGGNTVPGTAGNLAIIGAKASGAHITLSCTPRNIPALTNDDCSFSQYVANVTCSATFADRFNNVLGVATTVTFASEAGAAGQPAMTPAYDPSKPPAQQSNLGIATNIIRVNGGTLPKDVSPFAGELSVQYDSACGNLVHNPRDGLVTIIATAIGEEGFVDLNGNGQYDSGEPFIDVGEPFIDENDNGVRDSGEPFVDSNSDGIYNPPNGQWDANKVIWAETRVVYTGYLAQVVTTGEALSRFYTSGDSVPAPTPTATFLVQSSAAGNTSDPHPVGVMDRNLNLLTSSTAFSLASVNARTSSAFTTALTTVDSLGMSFTQLYCDHPTSPTACDNTCTTAPCYVVTNVGNCNLPDRTACNGFGYGRWGTVNITGACNTASTNTDWPDTIRLTSTLSGVSAFMSISGICQDR